MAHAIQARLQETDAAFIEQVQTSLAANQTALDQFNQALTQMEEMLAKATLKQNMGPFVQRYQREMKRALEQAGLDNATGTSARLNAITTALLPPEAKLSAVKH